jgi:polyhydroxyalkanoate synthase
MIDLLSSALGADLRPALAPTRRATLYREGSSRLLKFPRSGPPSAAPPVLLVPSMINRWYVLDLRRGASLVAALVEAGLDVYCLDWGVPGDEDRHLDWDTVISRVGRAIRRTRRHAGAYKVSIVGYCMGATVSAIQTALEPEHVAAFVNLAGPIDFTQAGCLGHMVDPRWFHAESIASAGNITGTQMQAGFHMLRPTAQIAKVLGFLERGLDPKAREAFFALEAWAADNVPFPAAAYVRYIRDLYQRNELVNGEHHIAGRKVDLRAIACPVRVVVASHDAICPAPAATALLDRSGTSEGDVLTIPGGHVGAVVGRHASTQLYPSLADWLKRYTCN